MKRSPRLPVLSSISLCISRHTERRDGDSMTLTTPLVERRSAPSAATLILALILSTLISATRSPEGLAQEVKNPRYQTAVRQAQTAAGRGKYKDAAEALRRAVSITPQPEMFYDIASFYDQANEQRLALKYYIQFIDQAPSDERVPAAMSRVEVLKGKLKDQYEEVMITSQPSKAYLYVNERAKGVECITPCRLKLLPGDYKVIAELDGHVATEQMLRLEEGANSQVLLTLYKESEVAPVTFLIDQPDAVVYIDRRRRAKSPLNAPLLIRQGMREIRVAKPGYQPWVRRVTVRAQQPMTVDVILDQAGREELTVSAPSSSSTLPWIIMGTGAALLGGSVYTGISAQGLYQDLETRRDQRLLIASDDIDVGNRYVLFTNVLMGLGITGLATGGVLWALEPPDSPRGRRARLDEASSPHTLSAIEDSARDAHVSVETGLGVSQ